MATQDRKGRGREPRSRTQERCEHVYMLNEQDRKYDDECECS